ncbi:radical SAM protein, partial [bacterium]|nr:radical SAM protein [bacterium]
MVNFLKKHKNIFIYGCDKAQILIEKYLHSTDIEITGFISSSKPELNKPVFTVCEAKKLIEKRTLTNPKNHVTKDTCVIISNEDYLINAAYEELKNYGFREIYFMSEWNKRTIPYKMTPRKKENFWLEVNIVDHCNLNCQCCDHFSPIADEYFLDIEDFKRDIKRLSELMQQEMGIFKIQGGEPTLHPQLIDFMRLTRKYFPKTVIFFFTNGILLPALENSQNGNLWQAMKDYDITLMVTTYPIKANYQKIDELAEKYNIKYERFTEIGKVNPQSAGKSKYYDKEIDKISVHHPFKLNGKVEKYQYISCYQFNESITLRHGKIYTCPFIPYVDYFNKTFNQDLKVTPDCYIDIYKAQNYDEIAQFCTQRTSFCSYCDIIKRNARKFAISKKE